MNNLTTFEHAFLTANDFDNPSDFDWLIEQNFDGFFIERKNHQWQLKIRHYVGVISLPSGKQLEILPKISQHTDILQTRQWLQQMLMDSWQALTPKTLNNLAQQYTINPHLPLNQWLAEQFWQCFQTYQCNQNYQRIEQNQPFLQGKLLVKQQLQYNYHQPHKFFHQTENFALDTASNRLVKTTLQHVIGGNNHALPPSWRSVVTLTPSQYPASFAQAQQELQALPTLIAQQNFKFLQFCYAILSSQQASGQGQAHAQSLLINMQFAFEQWVTVKLKQQLKQSHGQIFPQYTQALTADKHLNIKPDILITSPTNVIVADIKWKNINHSKDIQLADMYQLMTYASECGAQKAWLIVPSISNLSSQEIKLAKPHRTQFSLVFFNVTAPNLTDC